MPKAALVAVLSFLAVSVSAQNSPPLYLALGDSLAFGVGAGKEFRYTTLFSEFLKARFHQEIDVVNTGDVGWTSTDLLAAIQRDPLLRDNIQDADIITVDIGGNDLLEARAMYISRECGALDHQGCIRDGIARLKSNWTAILDEIFRLRKSDRVIIRAMEVYDPGVASDRGRKTWPDEARNDFQAFKPYVDEANEFICEEAIRRGVLCARIYAEFNGPSGDQDPGEKGLLSELDHLHPSREGHRRIEQALEATFPEAKHEL